MAITTCSLPRIYDGHRAPCVSRHRPVCEITTGRDDVFYLCDEGMVLHGNVNGCQIISPCKLHSERYNAIGGGGPEDDVYLVGDAGLISRWDGGEWADVESPTTDDLFGVAADGQDLWVVSRMGHLWHHDGRAWEIASRVPFGMLCSVAIVDGTVWAVGVGGVVLQHRPQDGESSE